jgi:glutamate N-acetyltransferase/amino-acid N-acetyltransferase
MSDLKIAIDGFQFSAVKSGIRGKDRLDIGLICCDKPAAAAAVFTKSLVQAAPVLLGKERIADGYLQAVMINSGVANACTGEKGMANAKAAAKMAADALGISEDLLLVSSTGVIGEQLDMACFTRGVPGLVAEKSSASCSKVAKAIMTTDTVPKMAVKTVQLGAKKVTIAGISKGAGMIMPNMATMLGFVMTDALIEPAILQEMLTNSVDLSFNRISVDGDSSTNDTVLVMAGGAAANVVIDSTGAKEAVVFQNALSELCLDLALQIVADGEGASKLVTIKVEGAATGEEADKAARCVANSALVKTAFFGEDANWGRIFGAVGRSGAIFDQTKVDISFDHIKMVEGGVGLGDAAEKEATAVLKKDKFTVLIDLKNGAASCEIYTCDFSIDYVKINADYRT